MRFWDDAIQNSSALRAALRRNLQVEIGVILGMGAAMTLWDMEKFYDNVDITQLMLLGIQYGYPRRLMSFGLQMHMACRGLKCYNAHPGHAMPTDGIIAGCTQSTTFAKVLFMEVMQNMHSDWQIGKLKSTMHRFVLLWTTSGSHVMDHRKLYSTCYGTNMNMNFSVTYALNYLLHKYRHQPQPSRSAPSPFSNLSSQHCPTQFIHKNM